MQAWLWDVAARELGPIPKFHPYWLDDAHFDSAELARWTRLSVPDFPPPRPEAPDVLMDLLATQLLALSRRRTGDDAEDEPPVLMGVQKKGMALLEELDRRLGLSRGGAEIRSYTGGELDPALPLPRRVVIIDDTLHRGKTLRDLGERLGGKGVQEVDLVAVMALERGLREAREHLATTARGLEIRSFCLLTLAEEGGFSGLFEGYVAPLLDLCGTGAIANRPRLTIRVRYPAGPQEGAPRLLRALAEMPFVDSLHQMPPANPARPSPVFHGTLFFTPGFEAELRAEFGPEEQTKIRVFIVPDQPFEVHLAPIWFGSDGRPADNGPVERIFAKLRETAEASLAREGFQVVQMVERRPKRGLP